MATLAPKPWNSPWDRAAERDPKYKDYCYGWSGAHNFSWRYLKRLQGRAWRTRNGQRMARAQREQVINGRGW